MLLLATDVMFLHTGMFIDMTPAILLFTPLFVPVAVSLLISDIPK